MIIVRVTVLQKVSMRNPILQRNIDKVTDQRSPKIRRGARVIDTNVISIRLERNRRVRGAAALCGFPSS
ncbi:hypothetical protein AQUCO_01700136v1 [Aquilegia coerulea]|uniref:Uncharacterized protein n=1 Tax=Aquilegia coerulea TaxID=218851 RepID=A0A2G5DLD3_AQUCA|nr:hypothetical protein AQUCO_01700136v1 [Aquilegia coerulea]